MVKNHFFTIFYFLFHAAIFTATQETHGRTVRPDVGAASLNRGTTISNQLTCPPILKKWVEDDFVDHESYTVRYKSEAESCQQPVEAYHKFLLSKESSTHFPNLPELSSYLSQRFANDVNPLFETYLSKCSDLTENQKKLAQVRLYNAAEKLGSYNSLVVDEIAYIDSVLPNSESLRGIDCSSNVWPGVKKNAKKSSSF